jgi:arylsulfatase A
MFSSLFYLNVSLRKIVSFVLILSAVMPLAVVAQTQRPNIILIFADDIGYEAVSPQNEEYDTPNLDRLSDAGIRFDNAFSNAVCTPSRVKILTGMSNVRNYTGFGRIDIDQTTFAHQLKGAGYATAMAGKWQLGKRKDKPQLLGLAASRELLKF